MCIMLYFCIMRHCGVYKAVLCVSVKGVVMCLRRRCVCVCVCVNVVVCVCIRWHCVQM